MGPSDDPERRDTYTTGIPPHNTESGDRTALSKRGYKGRQDGRRAACPTIQG
jgi:hypothetical protein